MESCWHCRLVPYERHVCNFIDDIPLPPPGKVEVVYYLTSTFPAQAKSTTDPERALLLCRTCIEALSASEKLSEGSRKLLKKDSDLLVRMASMNFENENSIIAPGITVPSKMARTSAPSSPLAHSTTSPSPNTFFPPPPPLLASLSEGKAEGKNIKILPFSTFKSLKFEEKVNYVKSLHETNTFLQIPSYTSFLDEQHLNREYESAYRAYKECDSRLRIEDVFPLSSLDTEIKFRLPPINEPHFGEGNIPLHPLFECLTAENVCRLFLLLSLEKQVVLVSSQYNLLTLCAEAAISLLYPLKWCYAFIPVLPVKLLGALGAPFPFFFGVHLEVYQANRDAFHSDEIVLVFLDEDRIENFPSQLPTPERRYTKLLAHLNKYVPWYSEENVLRMLGLKSDVLRIPGEKEEGTNASQAAASLSLSSLPYKLNIKNEKGEGLKYWQQNRRPLYDLAFSTVIESPMEIYCSTPPLSSTSTNSSSSSSSSSGSNSPKILESGERIDLAQLKYLLGTEDSHAIGSSSSQVVSPVYLLDEAQIREGFLKFFVSILLDYKKFLVYTPYVPSYTVFPSCPITLVSLLKLETTADLGAESNPSTPKQIDPMPSFKPLEKFRFEEFIQNSPSEWVPYLKEFVRSQSFSQFVDERVVLTNLDKNVLFFDESIDAKQNRYLFHTTKIDTPFLNLHQETMEEQSKHLAFLQHQLQMQLHQYHIQSQSSGLKSSSGATKPDELGGGSLALPASIPLNLSYQNSLYNKAYVPPTPQVKDLLSLSEEQLAASPLFPTTSQEEKGPSHGVQFKFRELNTKLLVLPRNLAARFNTSTSSEHFSSSYVSSALSTSDEVLKLFTQVRMKRKIKSKEKSKDKEKGKDKDKNKDKGKVPSSSSEGGGDDFALLPSTATGCIFSSYLVSLAQQVLRVSERSLVERRNGFWKQLGSFATSFSRKINEILFLKQRMGSVSFASPPVSPHVSRRFSSIYDPQASHREFFDTTKLSVNFIVKNIMGQFEDFHNLTQVEDCLLSLLDQLSHQISLTSPSLANDCSIDQIDPGLIKPYETLLSMLQASPKTPLFPDSFRNFTVNIYSSLPTHPIALYINMITHLMILLSVVLNYVSILIVHTHEQHQMLLSSLHLSTQVILEVFNILVKMDYLPEENVYRYLTECFSSCACSTGSSYLIRVIVDLMIFMDSEGYLPDHQIRYSLLRAMTTSLQEDSELNPTAASSPLYTMVNTSMLEDLHALVDFVNFLAQSIFDKYVLFMDNITSNYGVDFDKESYTEEEEETIKIITQAKRSFSNASREFTKRYKQMEKLLGIKSAEAVIKKSINSKSKQVAIEIIVGNLKISPYDVWTITNWTLFRKQRLQEIQTATNSTNSILLRAVIQPQPGGMIRFNDYESSSLSRMFFGGSSSMINDIASVSDLQNLNDYLFRKTLYAEVKSKNERRRSNSGPTDNDSKLPEQRPPRVYSWSVNPIEGFVPHLHWDNFDQNRKNIYSICKRLKRQVKIGEEMLRSLFTGLSVDFSQIACPNTNCVMHSISPMGLFAMLALRWERDPHIYTVRCIKCNKTFVPRFSVTYVPPPVHSDEGQLVEKEQQASSSEAVNPPLTIWKELLSPYTLYKELMNLLNDSSTNDSIEQLTNLATILLQPPSSTTDSGNSHAETLYSHRNTLFWNLIVHFRLRGLPYGFLLAEGNLFKAFPPKDTSTPNED